jgi:hypothetical protein
MNMSYFNYYMTQGQSRRYSTRGDFASAIGNAAGSFDHILEAGAKDLAASLSVAQLLVDGGCLLEAESVVLVIVGAYNRDCLGLDPGVEPDEFASVMIDSVRVG